MCLYRRIQLDGIDNLNYSQDNKHNLNLFTNCLLIVSLNLYLQFVKW